MGDRGGQASAEGILPSLPLGIIEQVLTVLQLYRHGTVPDLRCPTSVLRRGGKDTGEGEEAG